MGRRILLAWEGGAGRGHLVTLRIMAEALGPSHIFEAALCRMDHAAELRHTCQLVFPGAPLYEFRKARLQAGGPGCATWAEFLGDLTFSQPDRLALQLDWWVELIRTRGYDLVIGDFAPLSMLAARILNIPNVCVGTGYSVPPPGMDEFPVLLPAYARCIYDEATLLANVNAALERHGAAPLARFSDIYAASIQVPRTIAQLDPYDGRRRVGLLPPLNDSIPRATGAGQEVFCYFSTREQEDAELMAALERLDMPVRGFFPGMAEAMKARLAKAGIVIETTPVPPDLLGQRSRVVLHAGQHGTLCMALGLGLPQLAITQHLEHLFHARRAEQLGTVRVSMRQQWDADTIVRAIGELYESSHMARAAFDLSDRLRADLFGDIAGLLRQRLASVLA